MFSTKSSGSFKHAEKFLKAMSRDIFSDLDQYGKMGVDALSKATPTDTGKTARAWEYKVIKTNGSPGIEWSNTNVNNGEVIAILIQYGHGTGTGGYIQGVDYINPAIRPIFDKIAEDIWKKVTNA